ncbi:hypothetical protein B0H11DRAFT_2260318 [Mycena galericulata]|nr:hypothetical protein B0H11DRAFT_2260318 [Mycena galericulata]
MSSPVFPLDVERLIFELAATVHRGDIPRLILVASWVHVWLEPILYSVLLLSDGHISSHKIRYLSTKSERFWTVAPRHLLINMLDAVVANAFIARCVAVHDLAIYHFDRDNLPSLTHMRLS